jgi:hypothetical protein
MIDKYYPHEVVMPPKNVTVQIGQQGKDFVAMYPKDIVVNDRNVNGEIVFYKVYWSKPPFGVVRVNHGQYSFDVEHVMLLSGVYDASYHDEGISEIDLSFGLSETPTISHQEAHKKFYALLKVIREAGWKRCISPSDPRISGRDALVYSQNVSDLYPVDASYYPTFEEWMLIKDMTEWDYYADGVYMNVMLQRDQKNLSPHRDGAYFISINFKNKNTMMRQYFDYEERENWKQKYPAERKKYELERPAAEQKIRAEGKYKIDGFYKNPDQ